MLVVELYYLYYMLLFYNGLMGKISIYYTMLQVGQGINFVSFHIQKKSLMSLDPNVYNYNIIYIRVVGNHVLCK